MRNAFLMTCALALAILCAGVRAEQTPAKPAAPQGTVAKPPAATAAGPSTRPATSSAAPTMRYVGSVRDIMHVLVEASAEKIFDAVTIDVTAAGIKENRPETEEEWDELEHSAIALAESVNLIKMVGRPMAQPHEMKDDPDGPELPSTEIAARVNRSRSKWNKYADDLQDVAVQTLAIIRKKDVDGLFKIGADIDMTCENCHLEYWYPDDKKNRE